MKKIILLLLIIGSSLLVAGCAARASFGDIFASIKIGYQDNDAADFVTKDISLPTSTSLDKKVIITWESSDPAHCSNQGVIHRSEAANLEVNLTLTLQRGSEVESEVRKITIIKGDPRTVSVSEVYAKDLAQEVIVRGVYVDHTREDYFWLSDETRGILVSSDSSLFTGFSLYDEVIVYGTLEEFTNADSYQINATNVEKVPNTIVLQDNIITDFSENNLRSHINDRVSFNGFHLSTTPKIASAFGLTNGSVTINVYVESTVPNKTELQNHLNNFVVGQEVEINNAILTYYGLGAVKNAEIFLSRADQFILPNISPEAKLAYLNNFIINLYDQKTLTQNTNFIVSGSYDSTISYQVSSPYISVSSTGAVIITRPSSMEGDQSVTIGVTITIDGHSLSFNLEVIIKAEVGISGTLTYFFNFDNFSFPNGSNGYSEAYVENPALIMTSDVNGVISSLSVYKNRWQLTAPAGFEVSYNRGARFAPRLSGTEVTPGTLGIDLTSQGLQINMLTFDCGMLAGMAIDYAAIEYYVNGQWLTYSFLSQIGLNEYNHLEISGINASLVKIVINASTAGNNNNTYLTIDNLGIYTSSN
ncbi:MAG: hypothetical protein LBV55_00875 [Acholeplasmatales bacterium]|jgi:uncharacterized protein YdeI (BOF family)|nr:hypothetical protein [Acholeplasmatales bacterium]